MKKIIARKNFKNNNTFYIEDEEIRGLTYKQIVKFNEKGFIQPLEFKDLVLIKRELENEKQNKKEEEKL